jgi:hypothetical protein
MLKAKRRARASAAHVAARGENASRMGGMRPNAAPAVAKPGVSIRTPFRWPP